MMQYVKQMLTAQINNLECELNENKKSIEIHSKRISDLTKSNSEMSYKLDELKEALKFIENDFGVK